MKYCIRCGTANTDTAKFCVECGTPLDTQQSAGPQDRNTAGGCQNAAFQSGGPDGREEVIYTNVMPRSIPVAIILSIVTCGIYFLYWMYMINNEVNELAQDPMAPGGGIVILLSIVTCGIYSWYWYYKMGEKCDYITQSNSSSNLIFLILGIFGLGIVSVALMQDSVNRVLQ